MSRKGRLAISKERKLGIPSRFAGRRLAGTLALPPREKLTLCFPWGGCKIEWCRKRERRQLTLSHDLAVIRLPVFERDRSL
jgi:hypothetical protein